MGEADLLGLCSRESEADNRFPDLPKSFPVSLSREFGKKFEAALNCARQTAPENPIQRRFP
jgi:hypothetical protein